METVSYGDRNWPVLVVVAFLVGLIILDISLLYSPSPGPEEWLLIAGGIPLWVVLVAWWTRVFVRSRKFYCTTPACAITGRKRVFMPKEGQWICTQCKRPLTAHISTFPQQPQPIEAPSHNGSLGNTFLGGVAGLRIYRYKGYGEVSVVSGFHNPWGYGIYLTDSSLIGVSYTKYLSRAYRPGWILSIAWIAILTIGIPIIVITHTEQLPIWFIPFFPFGCFGCMILSLVFLLYLSPKRASKQIDSIQVNSIKDVETLPKDVILRRDDVSEINFRATKIRDPGHGRTPGSIISFSSNRTQPAIFVTTNREKHRQLVKLVQDFASENPPIRLTQD